MFISRDLGENDEERRYTFPYKLLNVDDDAYESRATDKGEPLWERNDKILTLYIELDFDKIPKGKFDIHYRILELMAEVRREHSKIIAIAMTRIGLRITMSEGSSDIKSWEDFEKYLERLFCLEIK